MVKGIDDDCSHSIVFGNETIYYQEIEVRKTCLKYACLTFVLMIIIMCNIFTFCILVEHSNQLFSSCPCFVI